MQMQRLFFKRLVVSLLIATPLLSIAETRQAVVERYYAAFTRKDYMIAAQYIRQSDLLEFKNVYTSIYRLEAQDGKRDFLDATFGKSARIDDALNAKPEEMFARVVSYVMNLAGSTLGGTQFYSSHILGEVAESQILVHEVVRYNMQLGAQTTSKVEIVSLAAEWMNWKIVIPDQLKNFGALLKQQLERRATR